MGGLEGGGESRGREEGKRRARGGRERDISGAGTTTRRKRCGTCEVGGRTHLDPRRGAGLSGSSDLGGDGFPPLSDVLLVQRLHAARAFVLEDAQHLRMQQGRQHDWQDACCRSSPATDSGPGGLTFSLSLRKTLVAGRGSSGKPAGKPRSAERLRRPRLASPGHLVPELPSVGRGKLVRERGFWRGAVQHVCVIAARIHLLGHVDRDTELRQQ